MSIIRGKIWHPDWYPPILFVGCEPHEWPKPEECEVLTLEELLARAEEDSKP